MSGAATPGFLAVAGRELRWIWQDRAAFLLVFIIPLLAASISAPTFSEPVIRRMRAAIVDQDRTQTFIFVTWYFGGGGVRITLVRAGSRPSGNR
jgi:hypothetical protein